MNRNTRPTPQNGRTAASPAADKRPQSRPVHSASSSSTTASPRPTVVIGGVPREQVAAPKKKRMSILEPLTVEAPRVHTVRAQRHTPFPFGAIFTTLICAGMLMYMVFNFVQINEYNRQLSSMQNQLQSLLDEQQSLELQLENRNDLGVISSLAENELGMVKMDEVEKIYLDGSGEDRIEIIKKEEPTEINGFSTLLSALFRNFIDLAEYID